MVELNNLQRQILFDENDVGLPKALVAAEKLRKVNSEVKVESVVDDVNHENIENIIRNMDVVLDGTDNMLVRFLINDACVKHSIPWVYGGAIETQGMTMNIIPGETPCFRCVIQNLPEAGSLPTCDTVGVLNSIPAIIASIESTEALKILLNKDNINRNLLVYNVWNHDFYSIKIRRRKDCECCVKHDFEFLNAEKKEKIVSLCGTDGVQITPVNNNRLSFEELEGRLRKLGEVEVGEVVLKFKTQGYEFNIFRSGRTIIYDTRNKKLARSLYARYVGV